MGKSLTFISIIVGYILGIFANSTQQMVLAVSGWDYSDSRYWGYVFTFLIALAVGGWFLKLERDNNNKSENNQREQNNNINDLIKSVNLLITEIREDRDERRNNNNRSS